jgi:ankyrin repeat protein
MCMFSTLIFCFQSQGDTALIIASLNGHVEVVKLLLAVHGIDYNHGDDQVRESSHVMYMFLTPSFVVFNHRETLHLP